MAEEVALVGDEVADDRLVGEGKHGGHWTQPGGGEDAGEAVAAVDVHRTAPAHALPARATERQRGVHLGLQCEETVQ